MADVHMNFAYSTVGTLNRQPTRARRWCSRQETGKVPDAAIQCDGMAYRRSAPDRERRDCARHRYLRRHHDDHKNSREYMGGNRAGGIWIVTAYS